MNIMWNLSKKRGNFRPVLRYTISLNEFEKNLCMPAVRIQSNIPIPPEAGWVHCWPGDYERGDWQPSEYYFLMTPSHKSWSVTEEIRLPWRASNNYPEVEESFTQLRAAFENVLQESCESKPLKTHGTLESTAAAKKCIAPAYAAERFLQVVKA